MKFSCKTQELLSGVQLVSRAIGTDQVLPILQNIHINVEGKQCTLSATNLELSIVTHFPVSIENEGSITVPAKAILNFLQYNQDEEVVVQTSEGTQLKLHSPHAKAQIAGELASGYPTIAGIQRDTTFTLPVGPFLTGLHLVTFTCARTNSRPVISGVFLKIEKNSLTIVGTDSYRLSEYVMTASGLPSDISCIVPARFLEELRGVIAATQGKNESEEEKKSKKPKEDGVIEVHLGSQQIEVHVGSTRLISRLIDGKFPDYTQVLPKEKNTTAVVSTKELLNAVRRMHYFAKEQSNSITFSFKKDSLTLSTKQTQIGQDESTILASVDGKDNKIAISSTYIIDFLSRTDAQSIRIEVSDKMHPALFKLPDSESFLHLIMPLRMGEE